MPSIQRSRSSTISLYTSIASEYERLVNDELVPKNEAKTTLKKNFNVSAQTISDALLFLKFPRNENMRAYSLYDQQFFSVSTLIFIFKAADRSNRSTNDVVQCLFEHYQLDKPSPEKPTKRGKMFPLSQTEVEDWMKDNIPPIR